MSRRGLRMEHFEFKKRKSTKLTNAILGTIFLVLLVQNHLETQFSTASALVINPSLRATSKPSDFSFGVATIVTVEFNVSVLSNATNLQNIISANFDKILYTQIGATMASQIQPCQVVEAFHAISGGAIAEVHINGLISDQAKSILSGWKMEQSILHLLSGDGVPVNASFQFSPIVIYQYILPSNAQCATPPGFGTSTGQDEIYGRFMIVIGSPNPLLVMLAQSLSNSMLADVACTQINYMMPPSLTVSKSQVQGNVSAVVAGVHFQVEVRGLSFAQAQLLCTNWFPKLIYANLKDYYNTYAALGQLFYWVSSIALTKITGLPSSTKNSTSAGQQNGLFPTKSSVKVENSKQGLIIPIALGVGIPLLLFAVLCGVKVKYFSKSSAILLGGFQKISTPNRPAATETDKKSSTGQEKNGCYFDCFVMEKSVFKKLSRIPTHEEAVEQGWLILLPVNVRDLVLFLSHRWLSDQHPDSENNFKLNGIKMLLDNVEFSVKYIWMDYFSIPQAPERSVEQLNAIKSLPYYVRQCYEFVTLIGMSGVLVTEKSSNFFGVDKANLEIYDSRGWCRLERFAAACPVIEGDNKRLIAARLWQYDMTSQHLIGAAFEDVPEDSFNPFEGDFRDGLDEKVRIAPMILELCKYIEQHCGLFLVQERSDVVKASALKILNKA